jgi:2,5-diamino-6-(ribosylamino)-4(3H)-pyrimidinone 5'-phosphate reductase
MDSCALINDSLPPDTLTSTTFSYLFLRSYLQAHPSSALKRPFLTLTYATSLDSSISLSQGIQTHLSGPQSKVMTHYLRSQHDAILVGSGTTIADDPGLNSRVEGTGGYGGRGLEGQPTPVILDPSGRWDMNENAKVLRMAREQKGRAPLVFWRDWEGKDTRPEKQRKIEEEKERILKKHKGKILRLPLVNGRMCWEDILDHLSAEGIRSVMVEGGGTIINSLLAPEHTHLINSVIITITPMFLGTGGVVVCPERRMDDQGNPIPVTRLKDITWQPMGEDIVLCGRLND